MEPVVLALASDERYFPGLYCAVASALSHLDVTSKVDLKVLDGGISGTSRDTLSKFHRSLARRHPGPANRTWLIAGFCCRISWMCNA